MKSRFLQHKSQGQVQWLDYTLMVPSVGVKAATFFRLGGSSSFPYATLNLSDRVGDDPAMVEFNLSKVEKVVGCPIIMPNQVHKINVINIDKGFSPITSCDGLVTSRRDIALGILHADCQAALFFDPMKKVIAVAHAGWRGLVGNIYASVVASMVSAYACHIKDLRVAISPSLGPCHAEFIGWQEIFPKSFARYQRKCNYFDLWSLARDQLEQQGVMPENIYVEPVCTYCCSDLCFSYRRQKVTGRNLSIISLNL